MLARLIVPIACAVALSCAAPGDPAAQPPAKVFRIGVLDSVPIASNEANVAAFRRAMRELGYVEGHNLAIEYRSADGRPERFTDLARELVKLDVDAIVTSGNPAAVAAKHATRTIPIVMASSFAPVEEFIVASLARPGGNVTGFHLMAPYSLGATRLHLLKELAPGITRLGVFSNPGDLYTVLALKQIEPAARSAGLSITTLEVNRPWEFDRAFETALVGQVDALVATDDYLAIGERARIVGFAAMSRIPAVYALREFVEAGGLMAYGTDRRDLLRRAAATVHKVLTGTRPADLPIEGPAKFELVINRKTATTLGLTIPPSLLRRADQIID